MLPDRSLTGEMPCFSIAAMAIDRIGNLRKLHLYLEEHMDAKGLGAVELAEGLQVARETVWRWRKGKQRPSNADIARIAVALECEPNDLFSPPPPATRPSIDAVLRGVSDEMYKHVLDFAVTVRKTKRG